MSGVDGATKRLGAGMNTAQLQTGRLGNQFAGLAGQLTGIHPIIGNVAGVLGNFSVGALTTAGILGGLAALALAYDVLTKSTREAGKAQDEAVKSLLKSRHLKIVGGQTGEEIRLARDKLNVLLAEGTRLQNELDANKGVPGLEGLTREKIQENQDAIHAVQQAIDSGKQSMEKATPAIRTATAAVKEFAVAAQQAAINWHDFVEMYAKKHGPSLDQITNEWAKDTLFGGIKEEATTGQFGGEFRMPNIGLDDGLTKEQIKTRDALLGNNDKNTELVTSAIAQSATIIGNAVVSALNIGGGGKGSQIGGALGSIGGMVLGAPGGPIGMAIGSAIGNVVGSAIGGLFDDNTKATNSNTLATRANTAALLLHAPSGFKTAGLRYDSTDVKKMADAARRLATRGGSPHLGTT